MSNEKQCIEYVWTDNDGRLRSKTRVLDYDPSHLAKVESIPRWNYDGSSTSQAEGHDSEVMITPRRVVKCPFRRDDNLKKGYHLIVLCDGYNYKDEPLQSNYRVKAAEIFEQKPELEPWYGIEQEFFLRDSRTGRILGFDEDSVSNPQEQGQYYCSVGASNAFGRQIMEKTLENFIYAGLTVSGINGEVAPGQWEYQIGPVEGIDAADQLYLSRYILERTAESFGVDIEYHPKPLDGDWNGSGCHTNFSTKPMREENGLTHIQKAINRLKVKHVEHMAEYGEDNNLRMTGHHETADHSTFSSGRANRGASVRIGNHVYNDRCGYFEDRRPASNMNPYRVTSIMFKTTSL
jgi:glutamine synthetase